MRKVETRIKVISKDDIVERYIPQIKGYNQSIVEWGFYFMPIFGQVFLLVSAWGFIKSFFWCNLNLYDSSYHLFKREKGSRAFAEELIDKFDAEYNKPKPIKHKKEISYIEYP